MSIMTPDKKRRLPLNILTHFERLLKVVCQKLRIELNVDPNAEDLVHEFIPNNKILQ